MKSKTIRIEEGLKRLLEAGDPFEPELQKLMNFKIRKVLLVASIYDYFLLEEDGRLVDLLGQAYAKYDLGYVPTLHREDDAESALNRLNSEDFDLVISMARLKDMDPFTLGRKIKEMKPGMPVVLLAYNIPDIEGLITQCKPASIDRVFAWHGDGKILVGIIKYLEDLKNNHNDCSLAGVQNILLIEDSVRFYSRYLHVLYEELWNHVERLLKENLTYTQKKSRQRKRPRVLLATSFEEGKELYDSFKNYLMGVITDLEYPINGKNDPEAGLKFARLIRKENPYLPILMQSSEPTKRKLTRGVGAGFLNKNSPTLIEDFRSHLLNVFYFGNLTFKDDKGKEIATARNLATFLSAVESIPASILLKYLINGDILRWLKARTDIALADKLEKMKTEEQETPEEFRHRIIDAVKKHRRQTHRGSVIEYSPTLFKSYSNFSKIGEGSIGGKARGLSFIDRGLSAFLHLDDFRQITISIPPAVVLATGLFDTFMRENDLLKFAVNEKRANSQIVRRFLKADLPHGLTSHLKKLLRQIKTPLAIRSSSLLEDSIYQPFAGIYATIMIPNDHPDEIVRLENLKYAIKCIYASTYFKQAKSYFKNTSYSIEDEKMAVIIQEVIGTRHGDLFYPDFSGIARSYNYYPVGGTKPSDGIAKVAVGLGKTIIDGEKSLQFIPTRPNLLPQFGSTENILKYAQERFWAVKMELEKLVDINDEDQYLVPAGMDVAESDGVLNFIGSTYSPENDRLYDGINRTGPKIVTFAHILKNQVMPLAEIITLLLKFGEHAMGCPVELEFSVTLDPEKTLPANFGLLQIRPMGEIDERVKIEMRDCNRKSAICCSNKTLGNGIIENLYDIVYVNPDSFDPSKTEAIAEEITLMNQNLRSEKRPYVLIGPGRWGSSDPWLGIPIKWNQIDNARVIVESSFENMNPDPSEGSHFFHRISSLGIPYFTIPLNETEGFIDWEWLKNQPKSDETKYVKHLTLDQPVKVLTDGIKNRGGILKPGIRGFKSSLEGKMKA